MKVLIADVGNPKNLGNIMALNSIKKLVKSASPEAKIIVHASHPRNKDLGISRFWNQSLYAYLTMDKANPLIRFLRFLRFIAHLKSEKYPPLPGKDLFLSICHDYWQSDVVIFISGTGFSAKSLMKDSIRLFFNNLIIKYAASGGRKVIIMPVGFGPFKYSFQSALAKGGAKSASRIFVRDNNSYQILQRSTDKVAKSYDPILFLNMIHNKAKNQKNLKIGITFRNWESPEFENFEIEIVEAFYQLAKVRRISFYPILIDHSGDKSAHEYSFYKVFDKYARSSGIKVNKAKDFSNLSDVSQYIQKLDFLVSLRTNSTLLAVTAGLPFAAFSKHEKVKLLLKDLKLKRFFLGESELNTPEGKQKLINFVANSGKQKAILTNIKKKIIKKDRIKFVSALSKEILTDSVKHEHLADFTEGRLSTLPKLA